jgi:glycosyltransferase involved in cell wall biosynthesis
MHPYFSIIIPAYNEEKYVEKTLNSIQSQSFSDYEVIVVLNGCTDNTEKAVKKYKKLNLRYFVRPEPQVSRARNYGAELAKGKVLVFLDADTQLLPDTLKRIKEDFTIDYAVATTLVLPDVTDLKYKVAMNFKNNYNRMKLYEGCSGILITWKKDFDAVFGYNPELQVREHRTLIKKLKTKGKYTCINTAVVTSMRRHQHWGLLKGTGFWIKQGWKEKFGNVEETDYEEVR